jgi:glutamyl-tRNA synthetase
MAGHEAPAGTPVRVRFAPSPTGNLHIGGARTALFNWLFARSKGGEFVLRIEDTDRERSRPEYVTEILESLAWLGFDHDRPLAYQSERTDLYRAAAERLIAEGKAYWCVCRPEELDARRKAAEAAGGAFHYDGRCSSLTPAEVDACRADGQPAAIRIRVPAGVSRWEDAVRGEVAIDHAQLDDFVIFKGDGSPTYHFAVVVDDADMGITHVIRGEDHISNTPKQMIIYEALGAVPPVFAHIPLIHGTDGGRLSKRHGATAVSDYRRQGFVAEALVNYLALLGWSPGGEEEILGRDELIARFDLGRVVKTPAVFDLAKLTWMNGVYLAAMPVPERTDRVIPYLEEAGRLAPGEASGRRAWLEQVVAVVGERIKLLADIVEQTDFLFAEVEPDEKAAGVIRKAEPDREIFGRLVAALEALADFRHETLEAAVRTFMEAEGMSAKRLFQPLRAALTGRLASPGLFESMELVGRERSLARIKSRLAGA